MKLLNNNNRIFIQISLFTIVSFIIILMFYSFYQNKKNTKELSVIGHGIGNVNLYILNSHIYIKNVTQNEAVNNLDSINTYFDLAKNEINFLILKNRKKEIDSQFIKIKENILKIEKISILKINNIDNNKVNKEYYDTFDYLYGNFSEAENEIEKYLVANRNRQEKFQIYLFITLILLFILMMFIINYFIIHLIKSEKELLKLSKRNDSLLKAIPDIIVEVDNNKVIRWTNSAGYSFFGKNVIKKEANYFFVEDGDETYNKVSPIFEGSEKTIYVQNWQRRKDGKIRLLAWWVRSIKNAEGKVVGALSTARDITEIHNFQEELKNYKNHLEKMVEDRTFDLINTNQELSDKINEKIRAEGKIKKQKDLIAATNKELRDALKEEKKYAKIKTNFVAQTSHEFRTPLAAIGFASSFLKKYYYKLDDQVINKKLSKIENEVQILLKLLDNVLNLEKSDSEKYNFVEYNLNEFLIPIIEEIKSATQRTHEVLLLNPNQELKIFIDYDIGRNIFNNLIQNAIKFSPKQRHIDVECSEDNKYIIISITDYGIGLNIENLSNLFEPFNRGINVGDIEGTGLGLAIVKEAIDKCKGKIDVKSKIDEGTTFTIKIPKKNEKNTNN